MSTLTKKHFECIAANLRERQPTQQGAKLGYHLAITAVANALVEINPRFDRQCFIEACCAPGCPPPEQEQYNLAYAEQA